jgi:hypothetical protein
MSKHGHCPICKKDFDTCPHSIVQVSEHAQHQKLVKLIDQRIAKALKERQQ